MPDGKACGSTAGYYQHRRAEEPPCDLCRRAIANRPRPMEDRVCMECGKAIRVRRDKPTRMCPDCARAIAGRASAEKSRKRYPSSPVRIRECSACSGLFVIRDPSTFARVRCEDCPPPTSTNERLFVAGRCAWCRESFVILDQLQAKYCSDSCGRKAQRAAHGRFLIPDHERQAIYERDEWVCQLCEETVDPGLGPSDIWAATLDHIVPQSHTLFPDHSAENLRLAHRWCNSVRGDETYYDESILKVS